MNELIDRLQTALAGPLPGREAQFRMAHLARTKLEFNQTTLPDNVRKSAVLVLFYPHADEWHIALMRRTASIVHSRQVGFPGGGYEEQDNGDLSRTALREAEEELSIPAHEVQLIGKMTDLYIPVSGNLVQPFVGFVSQRPAFVPDPAEVDEVIELPLSMLMDHAIVKTTDLKLDEGWHLKDVPYFDIYGNIVWGATAMMLSELLHILRQPHPDLN